MYKNEFLQSRCVIPVASLSVREPYEQHAYISVYKPAGCQVHRGVCQLTGQSHRAVCHVTGQIHRVVCDMSADRSDPPGGIQYVI